MSANTLAIVRDLKEALSKELPRLPSEDTDQASHATLERCRDVLHRLDECSMTLDVLSETLVGTVVKHYKGHSVLGPAAKALIKKWKALAKQQSHQPPPLSGAKMPPTVERRDSTGSAAGNAATDEWNDLPPLRKNICNKFLSVLDLSKQTLVKEEGFNETAVTELCVSRTSEVEAVMQEKLGNNRNAYTDKARSLVFNLKKNGPLRRQVLLGTMGAEDLVKLSTEQLATAEKAQVRQQEAQKLNDSRRLDWEQANEDKIDKMCGIAGDLKHASLFTCGRCKSTKTTSTQKQTRSADEPMTVFVLCLNCGKRWKFS